MDRIEEQNIEDVLGVSNGQTRKGKIIIWVAISAVIVLLVMFLSIWWMKRGAESAQKYITQEAVRGNLDVTITAIGTLEPVTRVDIGSELSGIVNTVEVDFNDTIKKGQVLARLDTATLESQVIKARAALDSANAKLNEAKTTLAEKESDLKKLEKSWELSGGKVPSRSEMDSARSALERARSAVITADAQISEARANLDVSKTSLSKAIIRSPIDGIVLKRAVEPGQTVAASLQAPVLFTIAENLIQMELHVFVDEADVGQIDRGQKATFNVDAYPDKSFDAVIKEVRFTPTESEGVVTYETTLTVDNTELLLRPGMTATAEITTQHIEEALLVPNAALRFTPKQPDTNSDSRSLIEKIFPRHGRRPANNANRKNTGPKVWILTGDKEQPLSSVQIKTGPSDGNLTVVNEGKLEPGQKVVVGAEKSGG